ncbi:hypothetical protein QRD43_06590 [Pelomonas sp. APW6]|uniref:EVE domain-containing protein n=1 Tax=Roseateles subflavus TaxID=3053353 RepID=A0ABT7LH22_9BURK|nr:hypothetical protein [Pelomonas sp. APW6]MDL5031572.1 hypothetical protein [Pelomonas sp. APW6]
MTAAFAIKTPLPDEPADGWQLVEQKTMYGGKRIAAGDELFLFDSENAGGRGLIARGVVVQAAVCAPRVGVPRQTPRVTLTVRRTATAARPLGRAVLRTFDRWDDGRPETELNFKLYRQATDKVVGLSEAAARWLADCFAEASE